MHTWSGAVDRSPLVQLKNSKPLAVSKSGHPSRVSIFGTSSSPADYVVHRLQPFWQAGPNALIWTKHRWFLWWSDNCPAQNLADPSFQSRMRNRYFCKESHSARSIDANKQQQNWEKALCWYRWTSRRLSCVIERPSKFKWEWLAPFLLEVLDALADELAAVDMVVRFIPKYVSYFTCSLWDWSVFTMGMFLLWFLFLLCFSV